MLSAMRQMRLGAVVVLLGVGLASVGQAGTVHARDLTPTGINLADRHGVGYEAWAWDAWNNCGALIRDCKGAPYSAYGRWLQAHYAARAGTRPAG
jgi:hypothetical protein